MAKPVKLKHRERKARRQKMARAVARAPIGQRKEVVDRLAKSYGVNVTTVLRACREFRDLVPLTHEQRRLRNETISQAMGHADLSSRRKLAAKLAETHDVSLSHVHAVCRKNGIEIPARPAPPVTVFPDRVPVILQVVAGLLHGEQASRIAGRLNVTRQYVSQVRKAAAKVGIPV
jgi:hypothetical protein